MTLAPAHLWLYPTTMPSFHRPTSERSTRTRFCSEEKGRGVKGGVGRQGEQALLRMQHTKLHRGMHEQGNEWQVSTLVNT